MPLLIFVTGALLACICFLILLVKGILKLVSVPIILLFTLTILAIDSFKRRLHQA